MTIERDYLCPECVLAVTVYMRIQSIHEVASCMPPPCMIVRQHSAPRRTFELWPRREAEHVLQRTLSARRGLSSTRCTIGLTHACPAWLTSLRPLARTLPPCLSKGR